MNRAETAVERYHARLSQWPKSHFTKEHDAVREEDPALPGVRFYRYPDGSVARVDPNGDADA